MSSSRPTVCVFGATGSQGGALAHQLRGLNWNVRAIVRTLSDPNSEALKAAGVQLTHGDWDNNEALQVAISGCDKLFLCLLPDFEDQDRERRQATNIVKIAHASGVKQVVASTSLTSFVLEDGLLEPGSLMHRHSASKKAIEQAVADGGFDYWTFLRPAFFMANFLEPKVARYPEPRDHGTWTTSMTPESELALVDHVDIAKFAIAAFQDPERFNGKAIGLASELLTVQQTLDQLGTSIGRPLRAIFLTDEELAEARKKKSNVFTNSQPSLRLMANYVNLEQLADTVTLTTFKQFLDREQSNVKATYQSLDF
ncbi:hypothetical protein SUNI508_11171 [Seiridium unicorne]|uniref:NmrA-like domain-containing protein n=1 Tax=Seiridium unicorne TaxID=138068 RepID=A0ABR2UJC2_9PEZI